MSVPNTRVPTHLVAELAARTAKHLDDLEGSMSELLVVLEPDERRRMPRVRNSFLEAALQFSDVLKKRPDIVAITKYDAEAVVEDLQNVLLIAPLLPRLEALAQRVSDSELQWLAEAQEPTYAAYSVARTLSERDGSLGKLIEPMRKVLSNRRSPEEEVEEGEEEGEAV